MKKLERILLLTFVLYLGVLAGLAMILPDVQVKEGDFTVEVLDDEIIIIQKRDVFYKSTKLDWCSWEKRLVVDRTTK